MKSLLESVRDLDELLNNLQKTAGFIRMGHDIDAWRECHRIIANVNKNKQDLIASANRSSKNEE